MLKDEMTEQTGDCFIGYELSRLLQQTTGSTTAANMLNIGSILHFSHQVAITNKQMAILRSISKVLYYFCKFITKAILT